MFGAICAPRLATRRLAPVVMHLELTTFMIGSHYPEVGSHARL